MSESVLQKERIAACAKNDQKKQAAEEIVIMKYADMEPAGEIETAIPDFAETGESDFPCYADELSSNAATAFHVDKSLDCLEFAAMEDIIGIFQSLNVARINTKGTMAQNAKAYICGLKKRGKPSVFIIFQIIDKNEALIYVPERQPANSGDYKKTIADAVDFIETAGFLMDSFALRGKDENHAKAIGKIPILHHVP